MRGSQEPTELGLDEFVGYPVDAGGGTSADLVAVGALAGWECDRLDEVFIPAQVPPIDAITDEASGANLITVSTGGGDGSRWR